MVDDWKEILGFHNPAVRQYFHAIRKHKAVGVGRTFDARRQRSVPLIEYHHSRLKDECQEIQDSFRHNTGHCRSAGDQGLHASMAEVVGGGSKIFFPTADECEAMQHISLNVPRQDYRQPFPGVAIVIPKEAGQSLRFNGKGVVVEQAPSLLIVYHDPAGWIFLSVFFEETVCSCAIDMTLDLTLEEELRLSDDTDEALITRDYAKVLWRIAFNSCLLMTHYKTISHYAEPDRASFLEKKLRTAKKVSEKVRDSNRIEMLTAPKVLRFEQHVHIFRRETGVKSETSGNGTQSIMPPHWRLGHWAMQPYGPESSLRKRIFRPATFVNSHLFVGKHCDTVVRATTT
jgi:hypothetical protein